MIFPHAAMAELVDALDSGSSRGNSVEVRLFLAAIERTLSPNLGPSGLSSSEQCDFFSKSLNDEESRSPLGPGSST